MLQALAVEVKAVVDGNTDKAGAEHQGQQMQFAKQCQGNDCRRQESAAQGEQCHRQRHQGTKRQQHQQDHSKQGD